MTRGALVDDRDRPVLELARGEALGVDVGQLLELERTLQRDGEPDVPAEEEDRVGVGQRAAQRPDLVHAGEHLGDGLGQAAQVVDDRGDLVLVLHAAHLGEEQPDEVAGDDLAEERLGRGDGDLGAGVRVEHGVGLARDGRAVGVADGQDAGPLLPRVAQRHQRVHRLAGLADDDDQRRPVEHRVAVAELAGDLDLDGDAGPVLDRVLGDQPGVVGGAAGDHEDLVDVAQLLVGEADLVQDQVAVLAEPAEQGVGDGLGLLGDLLEHEPVVAALLGGGGVPVDRVGGGLDRPPVEVGDGDAAVAVDLDDLVLAELERVAGVADEGGDVGPRKYSPSPTPTTSGLLRRDATRVSGSVTDVATRVNEHT